MFNTFFRNIFSQNSSICVFGCKIDGTEYVPESIRESQTGNRLHLSFNYAAGASEDIFITQLDGTSCTVLRRFRNNSRKTLNLNELFCKFSGISFGGKAEDDYFYHLENPRMYAKFCLSVDEDHFKLCRDSGYDPVAGNRWSDPGTIHERVGRSPYQPFPAILLSNKKCDCGIVHGTLSQSIFYHCYET